MNKRIYYFGTLVMITGLLFSGVASGCGSSSPKITPTPGPEVKHALKGYENCIICHETGTGGAPKYPTNHAGRTNDQCAACHKIS